MTPTPVVRLPGRSGCRNSVLKDPIYKSDLTSPPCWPEVQCAKGCVGKSVKRVRRAIDENSRLSQKSFCNYSDFFFHRSRGLRKRLKRVDRRRYRDEDELSIGLTQGCQHNHERHAFKSAYSSGQILYKKKEKINK